MRLGSSESLTLQISRLEVFSIVGRSQQQLLSFRQAAARRGSKDAKSPSGPTKSKKGVRKKMAAKKAKKMADPRKTPNWMKMRRFEPKRKTTAPKVEITPLNTAPPTRVSMCCTRDARS